MTVTFSVSLPQPAFDAKQVQQNEAQVAQDQAIKMYDLMEHAGAAVFEAIEKNYSTTKNVLIVCGKGNNGGDGYIVARLALQAGMQVQVFVLVEKNMVKGDAARALLLAEQAGVAIEYHPEILTACQPIKKSTATLIVDGIFGIGFAGTLAKPLQQVITAMNDHSAKIIAVDVPSGLSADTGWVECNAVVADSTISFIALKKGLLTGQAANHVGQLLLAELNLGQAFVAKIPATAQVQNFDNLPELPNRKAAAHKGSIGLVLTIGSNDGMPGAIRMSSEAALRCGASLVAVCCQPENHQMVMAGRPELMLAPASAPSLALFPNLATAKAIVIGPGLGQDEWAKQLFSLICHLKQPRVIDADALQLLSQQPQKQNNWVLTPHPGEAAKLLGCEVKTIEQDRFVAVKKIANQYGGICLLKGAGSLISDGKSVWINTSGNSGMATGGMGDVLSGIIAALIVQMPNRFEAVRLAVFIHGQAADNIAQKQGKRGILASDLFSQLPQLVNKMTK